MSVPPESDRDVAPSVFSCYGAVQSLSGDAERDVAVEAVGQGECSLYSEDTVTDEEGRFRLRGLLVSRLFKTGCASTT